MHFQYLCTRYPSRLKPLVHHVVPGDLAVEEEHVLRADQPDLALVVAEEHGSERRRPRTIHAATAKGQAVLAHRLLHEGQEGRAALGAQHAVAKVVVALTAELVPPC